MDFSIVIPTYNRAEILARTLRSLARQEMPPDLAFEVFVVDDGSVDDTAELVKRFQAGAPYPLRYLYQENKLQGAARNAGASHAEGEQLLFLGDDTIPDSTFLAEHQKAHLDQPSRLAVIGYTPWADEIEATPFMRYIGEEGWQFGFSLIEDPEDVPFNFFYTSNISLNRKFFLQAGGFDEDFQEYGWEDMELSLRLKKQGMQLVYRPQAIARHYHPTSLRSFTQRQRKVGYSAWTFYDKHPEMKKFLHIGETPRYGLLQHFRFRLLTWIAALTEKWRWPDLSRYYPDLMSYYYNLGMSERARRQAS